MRSVITGMAALTLAADRDPRTAVGEGRPSAACDSVSPGHPRNASRFSVKVQTASATCPISNVRTSAACSRGQPSFGRPSSR